jgi:hypothetical protein
MFLFAKLVMENFYKQINRENLNKELEPNRFPRGLEEAYVMSLIYTVLDAYSTVFDLDTPELLIVFCETYLQRKRLDDFSAGLFVQSDP